MIKVDTKQIDKFAKSLGKVSEDIAKNALVDGINRLAFTARGNAIDIIESDFTLRNNFTTRQLQVVKAKKSQTKPFAILGHTQQYMEDQEFGAVKVATGKEGVSIATSESSNEGKTARPRKKLPRGANAMRKIQLKSRRVTGKTNKQRLLLKVRLAVSSGNRYIFHDFGGKKKKGIFKIRGGTKKGFKNRGWPKGARMVMMHDMSQKSVRIKPSPWLQPAIDFASQTAPDKLGDELEKAWNKQLRRGV